MQLASSPAFYEQPLAAMPQLSEKPRQGFATKKTTWKPASNVCNSTVAIGLRAGLVLEGVRKTYRARYYNPVTGRFLSEDPIGFAGSGPNLYEYAEDNSISFNDPYGLTTYACTVPLHALGTIGGSIAYYSPLGYIGSPADLGVEHEYLCTVNGKTTICGGQSFPTGNNPFDSPGTPSQDTMSNGIQICRRKSNKPCVDDCVNKAINDPNRPNYSVINVGGTNCQQWAENVLKQCKKQCGGY